MNVLAQRLRHARAANKQSLEAVAAAAGISKTYLWELERHQRSDIKVSVDIVGRLADALKVQPAWLVGWMTPDSVKSLAQRRADELLAELKELVWRL